MVLQVLESSTGAEQAVINRNKTLIANLKNKIERFLPKRGNILPIVNLA